MPQRKSAVVHEILRAVLLFCGSQLEFCRPRFHPALCMLENEFTHVFMLSPTTVVTNNYLVPHVNDLYNQ